MNNPEYVKVGDREYKINTDFRVAIECDKIARSEIDDYERALAIIYKLFGEKGLKSDDKEELFELGLKYLRCGKEPSNEEPDMSFEQDMDLIEASFMSDYHLDLSNQKMHWWTFNKYLNGLSNSEMGNCCILNRVRNIRNMDISQFKGKDKDRLIEAKRQFALKKETKLTEEQQKSADMFMMALERNNSYGWMDNNRN